MKAVVYHGPGNKAWEEVPEPEIVDDTDAIVRVDTTTICGTDLHILRRNCQIGGGRGRASAGRGAAPTSS